MKKTTKKGMLIVAYLAVAGIALIKLIPTTATEPEVERVVEVPVTTEAKSLPSIEEIPTFVTTSQTEETLSTTEEDKEDLDPLTFAGDEWYEEEEETATYFEVAYDEGNYIYPESTVSLSFASSGSAYSSEQILLEYAKWLEYESLPFTYHERSLELSEDDQRVLRNVLYGEIYLCSFEQQVATVGMILNMMETFDKDLYTLVTTPGVFDLKYAEGSHELPEKSEAAIACALAGIDFSNGALAYCTYTIIDPSTKAWFDSLKKTAEISVSTFYNDDGITSQQYCYLEGRVVEY